MVGVFEHPVSPYYLTNLSLEKFGFGYAAKNQKFFAISH